MNIKYKISKESLVLQAITSFLPLGASMFCLLNYCCPIKPLHAALLSLNAAEILMISSNFQFQAPLE